MKKYRLKKDMPHMRAGIVYFLNKNGENGCDGNTYLPDIVGMNHERWGIHKDYVENNPEWFEDVSCAQVNVSQWTKTKSRVECNLYIPREKVPAIKKAIEFVLNERVASVKTYTEQELIEAEEKAFNAAKMYKSIPNTDSSWWRNWYTYSRYKTFSDYKNDSATT